MVEITNFTINLFSGLIGALIGLIGALICTILTIIFTIFRDKNKESKNLARERLEKVYGPLIALKKKRIWDVLTPANLTIHSNRNA